MSDTYEDGTSSQAHVLQAGSIEQEQMLEDIDRRHPHFWFEDGDLLLASSTLDFRVHLQKIIALSPALMHILQPLASGLGGGIVCLPILGDDADDWACLLGLIYDEGGNSLANPTLHEVIGVLAIAGKYAFLRIEGWATAHLRADFFPNPLHFQDQDDGPQRDEKVLNALAVIAASHHTDFQPTVLGLAYYALARLDPDALNTKKYACTMSPPALDRMLTGQEDMELHFDSLVQNLLAISRRENTSIAHNTETCGKMLSHWAADARISDPDLLKALRRMWAQPPRGPICYACTKAAHGMIEEETLSMVRNLPVYFGFPESDDPEHMWKLAEDLERFLSKSFRI